METHGTSPPSGANFRMIDVGEKADTHRVAQASGRFFASLATIQLIREKKIPKGDPLVLAEVAGIQAAKNTSSILPLCHPLPLHSVRVWSEMESDSVTVFCEASTSGKTGVEMEALTGVGAALLCIYDLVKVVDPVLRIGDIQLGFKKGGKSGHWVNPNLPKGREARSCPETLPEVRASVLTISDRCSRGEAEDLSGTNLAEWLVSRGARVVSKAVVPDGISSVIEAVEALMRREQPQLVITTGGTGLSPRDLTPEAFRGLIEKFEGREIPGIGELLRASGSKHKLTAWLSRCVGVQIDGCTLICLPGSPNAVREGLAALEPLLPHLLHIQKGGDHSGKSK